MRFPWFPKAEETTWWVSFVRALQIMHIQASSAQWADRTSRATCLDQFPSSPIMEAIGLWLGPAQHDSCSVPALSLPWRQPWPAVKLLSCKDLKPAQKLNTPGIEQDGFSEHWSKRIQMYWKHFFFSRFYIITIYVSRNSFPNPV